MYEGTHTGDDHDDEEGDFKPDDEAHDGQPGPSFKDWI